MHYVAVFTSPCFGDLGKVGDMYPSSFAPFIGTPRTHNLCSRMDSSPHWGAREGKVFAPILIYLRNGDPVKFGVMRPYPDM